MVYYNKIILVILAISYTIKDNSFYAQLYTPRIITAKAEIDLFRNYWSSVIMTYLSFLYLSVSLSVLISS